MSEHQHLYSELLRETAKAYELSEIKKFNWYYSVCSTPIHLNSTLVLGFNWGVGNQQKHEAQKENEMPTVPFDEMTDLGSMNRTLAYFTKYCKDGIQSQFVQSNYCFFRSKKDKDISSKDLELSNPLFESFLKYTSPSRIISFSSRLRNYLLNSNRLDSDTPHTIKSNKKSVIVSKATLLKENQSTPIYFLPHPNYPITNEARDAAWLYCFPQNIGPYQKKANTVPPGMTIL